jgi:hypothetical protein
MIYLALILTLLATAYVGTLIPKAERADRRAALAKCAKAGCSGCPQGYKY